MSIRSILCITCVRSSNISDSAFPSCFPGAGIDLSVEDNVVALALAECPTHLYAELIKSDIPGPLNVWSARSTASRPLPPSTMGVSSIGLCHAPIPGPTQSAIRTDFRDARLRTGTLYLIFFLKSQLAPVGMAHTYNNSKYYIQVKRTTTGVVSIKIYTHITESHLHIQN